MEKPRATAGAFWDVPLPDLLRQLETTPVGLTSEEAARRLHLHGTNCLAQESRFAVVRSFLQFFANPLVIILLAASVVSLVLGDRVGGTLIISMVLMSVLLNFFMEFQAHHAVAEIRRQVATTATVVRDGKDQELAVTEIVPGDVIRLHAGDLAARGRSGASRATSARTNRRAPEAVALWVSAARGHLLRCSPCEMASI